MHYQEILDFLFNQFPSYQNIGGKAFKPGLQNIKTLCKYLGNPQDNLKIVHVAGTNGKGSTCSMLSSIFQESGYSVGLFTSPHLIDYRERIRINGVMIPKEWVIEFVNTHFSFFSTLSASFFEWTTAMAFSYFESINPDVVILETGLGGRLDATNIANPMLTIITKIGIDHTQYLGNTIEDIAKEKGGIIKKQIPCVISKANQENVLKVLQNICNYKDAKSLISETTLQKHSSDLGGSYQNENISTVLEATHELNKTFSNLTEQNIRKGLNSVRKNTNFRGRWEILNSSPTVIADIGHNFDGVKQIVEQLKTISYSNLKIVWGMVEDKEIEKIVSILPKDAQYYLSQPKIKRALKKEKLASYFKPQHYFHIYESISKSYLSALNSSNSDDLIFVGGSNFVVSEIILEFFE